MILVGHVTKDGQIAGPRVVEHMVDAVVSFEGDGGHHFRILRAVKNRFGPTDEIGVFEMTGPGPARSRQPVGAVPRRARHRHRRARRCSPAWRARGPCWSKSRRWWRPRRSARRAAPWSAGTRAGCPWCSPCWRPMAACGSASTTSISTSPGGLRISEPAADLAAAAALISSLSGSPCRRYGLFRRARPVRGHPPGGAGACPAEGGDQARLLQRGDARTEGGQEGAVAGGRGFHGAYHGSGGGDCSAKTVSCRGGELPWD